MIEFKEDFAMDEGFFGGLFDLNGDGELDAGERTLDFMAFNDLMIGAEKAERPEYVQELEDAGLDYDELWHMTDWERREALEDAGMDPDDFDM